MSTQISLIPDSGAGPEPLVFLKDRMVPASQASIAIFDAGIILGATVTDMTRTFHHKPFRLEDHIDRFYRSARYTRIQPPFDRDRMEEISRELVRHNARLLPSRPGTVAGPLHDGRGNRLLFRTARNPQGDGSHPLHPHLPRTLRGLHPSLHGGGPRGHSLHPPLPSPMRGLQDQASQPNAYVAGGPGDPTGGSPGNHPAAGSGRQRDRDQRLQLRHRPGRRGGRSFVPQHLAGSESPDRLRTLPGAGHSVSRSGTSRFTT